MTPVLGIIASSTRQGQTSAVGSYDALATVVVPAGGLASVVFAGIPSGYRNLQIRCIENITNSFNDQGYSSIQFNGDTLSNYSRHQLTGNGTSAGAYGVGGQTSSSYGFAYLVNATSSFMAANIIDIIDYSNDTKNKTYKCLSGMDFNGSGFTGLFSGSWNKVEPITSIRLFNTTGDFRVNSRFALYGIK
jgi:hypothetical protein